MTEDDWCLDLEHFRRIVGINSLRRLYADHLDSSFFLFSLPNHVELIECDSLWLDIETEELNVLETNLNGCGDVIRVKMDAKDGINRIENYEKIVVRQAQVWMEKVPSLRCDDTNWYKRAKDRLALNSSSSH